MSSTRNPGRVAGLWYLLLIALGPLFLIYIPNKLFVHGNAAALQIGCGSASTSSAARPSIWRFLSLARPFRMPEHLDGPTATAKLSLRFPSSLARWMRPLRFLVSPL